MKKITKYLCVDSLITFETIKKSIETNKVYDLKFYKKANSSNGWKLSIQGKTSDDVLYLFCRLSGFLDKNRISFKLATQKRLNAKDSIQSHKLMTIYVPDHLDTLKLAEQVYKKIKGYKGWFNIKTPPLYSHYAGGIFYRNDLNSKGEYIQSHKYD
jgi:hypothetical protein